MLITDMLSAAQAAAVPQDTPIGDTLHGDVSLCCSSRQALSLYRILVGLFN